MHDSCRLGRDQTLMVDNAQNRGFNKLRFHDRCHNLYHGFSREHQRAFRNAVDIAVEAEVGKIIQKIRVKDLQSAQVLDVLCREVQIFNVSDKLFNAAHDRIAAAERIVAEKRVENNGFVFNLVLEIALHHREFVQIGEQRQVLSVHFTLRDWIELNWCNHTTIQKSAQIFMQF